MKIAMNSFFLLFVHGKLLLALDFEIELLKKKKNELKQKGETKKKKYTKRVKKQKRKKK